MFKKFKMFLKSSRFKITIWYTLLFLFLELLFGSVVYFYLYTKSQHNLDAALKTQASAIINLVSSREIDFDTFQPDSIYSSAEDVIWDAIYDAVVFNRRNTFIQLSFGGKIIFKSDNLEDYVFDLKGKSVKGDLFDFRNPSLSDSDIRGCQLQSGKYLVAIAYPTEHISQTLTDLTDLYILIAPIFLLVSFIGGSLLASKSLARLDTLIKKTEEITAHNLDEVIPGGEYSDEYGRLIKKLNEMISRIKTSVDFMNQFSVSAAHELKTPLTILRGETEIALKSEKLPSQYIEILKSNYEEIIRLIKIVENLFFISKSDNSLIAFNKTPTDLNEFLTGIVNSLRFLGSEKNMELLLVPGPDISISFDNELMKQVIMNLIDNAVKYGYENTNIILSSRMREWSVVRITVTNSGDGIPMERAAKIFDRFYRVDTSRDRKSGGAGLGLAVVKSIITHHNGNISVFSNPGGETTFSIDLPANGGGL